MASIYNVNLGILAARFLNGILNKSKLISWSKCLVSPIQTIHVDFLAFRKKTNEDLSYNSQTMIFEYLLNKKFNNNLTGIWIENVSSDVPSTFIFEIEEGEPIKPIRDLSEGASDKFIYSLEEFQSVYDFIVHVPIATLDIIADPKTTAEMHAIIKKYKISGKRYTIKNY